MIRAPHRGSALPRAPRNGRPHVRLAVRELLPRCSLLALWRVVRPLLGCSKQSSDVVTEPTPSVPSDVVFYTHVLYGGDDAYLVDGQWFRPATTGWVVFTKEPLELRSSVGASSKAAPHRAGGLFEALVRSSIGIFLGCVSPSSRV